MTEGFSIMTWIEATAISLAIWNAIVFILYGLDKLKAKRGGRRISEKTLFLAAALMGSLGAFLGMVVFRHKTKHTKFKIGVPLLLILNIAAIVVIALKMELFTF